MWGTLFYYINNTHRVLFVSEIVSNFVIVIGQITDILKVFSQSLIENVEVFKERRQTNSTHFLYMYENVGTACVNASRITGVGHCIVYSLKVFPQPSCK